MFEEKEIPRRFAPKKVEKNVDFGFEKDKMERLKRAKKEAKLRKKQQRKAA